MRRADDSCLGDPRMRDQRGFDFHRAQPVPGDVEHVVDATHDPEVAVGIAMRAVARDVEALLESLPVRLIRSAALSPQIVRSIDGQGLRITRIAAVLGLVTALPSSSTMSASMPGSGSVHEPGLVGVTPGIGEIMIAPVSVCHQVSTIGQRPLPITRVIPHPGLGIDRLADTAEQAQLADRS